MCVNRIFEQECQIAFFKLKTICISCSGFWIPRNDFVGLNNCELSIFQKMFRCNNVSLLEYNMHKMIHVL